MPPQKIGNPEDCRARCLAAAKTGKRVALVPTMGALHEGHLSLLRAARAQADFVVVSIFVNPTQFGEGEDLAAYPRPLEADLAACNAEGVDLVFAPDSVAQMYPPGFQTTVKAGALSEHLEGATRPGHFDGVATVVSKLFGIVQPDLAFFGEKDFQQLVIIRRLVRDLNLKPKIMGCPTVRDADGLALSSRNAYFSEAYRAEAAYVPRALRAVQAAFSQGQTQVSVLLALGREILEQAQTCQVNYFSLVDPERLTSLAAEGQAQPSSRLLASVQVVSGVTPIEGSAPTVHLIDNLALGDPLI